MGGQRWRQAAVDEQAQAIRSSRGRPGLSRLSKKAQRTMALQLAVQTFVQPAVRPARKHRSFVLRSAKRRRSRICSSRGPPAYAQSEGEMRPVRHSRSPTLFFPSVLSFLSRFVEKNIFRGSSFSETPRLRFTD